MKLYQIIAMLCITYTLSVSAQEGSCEQIVEEATKIIASKSPFINNNKLFNNLKPCADMGQAKAQNYIGFFYLKGIGVEQNKEQAFKYIKQAAEGGLPIAQYNLARLYKQGTGCSLNLEKAVEWFEKASFNGNQKAAYSLGYMYYKGYGVQQDYQKAVAWFKKSTYPMAIHFLGLCYYFGYGIEANQEKALEILLSNTILNSKLFLEHIEKDKKEKINAKIQKELEDKTPDRNPIEAEAINETPNTLNFLPEEALNLTDIKGEWKGKLVQYDWSGKHIQRILPVTLTINVNNQPLDVNITCFIEDQKIETNAIWQDETLYLKDITQSINLPVLYPDIPEKLTLNYNFLSTTLQSFNYNETSYLIGRLESFIPEWREYGKPINLILRPKDEESNLSEDVLTALTAQKDQFIKLYPVPFNEQLIVQYQLEKTDYVYAELISLNGTNKIVILPTTEQQAGNYTYNIPISLSLPKGLYVVKVTAGNQLHTRMIIKDN